MTPPASPNPDSAGVTIHIQGRVQGVGYRYFAEQTARDLGLTGWVRNLAHGDVEAQAEGPKKRLEDWLQQLRKGPPLARIDDMKVDWMPYSGRYSGFSIRM